VPRQAKNEIHHLEGGAVVLYKRKDSAQWQFRIKLNGRWKPFSAHSDDLREAISFATRFYYKAQARADLNLAPETRKFKGVCEATVRELRAEIEREERRSIKSGYISIIERYFIPLLGNYNVENIDHNALLEFDTKRADLMGRLPKKSTIQDHNAAMGRCFETALRHNWLKEWQVPRLFNHGEEGETRATFSQEEFENLELFLAAWSLRGRKAITRDTRAVLREFVHIVANTGMRPGTETKGLTWNGVEDWRSPDGNRYVRFWVPDGKTDKRDLIAHHSVRASLVRLRTLNGGDAKKSVFARPDGIYPPDLHGCFEIALKEARLLTDRNGDRRSLYSLRHYYATQQLLRGFSYETLAKQMGTSVAMLEKHYSKVTPSLEAARLSGQHDARTGLALSPVSHEAEPQFVVEGGRLKLAK
jgi:hypothetical protein